MKSSGGILRGHLRPIGARSPPFVVIGLLVILGILVFNYWNLTYEYDAIVKEIAELQDHLRMAVLKKETADTQSEAMETRFREAEQQLGNANIKIDQNQRDIADLERKLEIKNSELLNAKGQLETCQTANTKLNSNQEIISDLQRKIEQLEEDKSNLSKVNSVIASEKDDLKLKAEQLQRSLAVLNSMRNEPDPFQNIQPAQISGLNVTEASEKNTTTPLPEKLGQKSKEYNNENNVLKPPVFNQNLTNKELPSLNDTKNAKNESQVVQGAKDGELTVAGVSDLEVKDKLVEGNNSKEGNGIEDELAMKSVKSELNTTVEEDYKKSPNLQMPKLDDAQLIKPVNLSEHSANEFAV